MAGEASAGSSDDAILDHRYDEAIPPSTALVRAICVLEDVDPVSAPAEAGFVLFEHVDPDALDRLIGEYDASDRVRVSFTIDDYLVEIDGAGRIVIYENES